jgi:pilus assembly protein CpaB
MNRVQIAVLGVTVMAFAGAYAIFNFAQAPTPQAVQVAPRMDTDEVLVAAHDLAMGTQLAEPDFTWQKWPTQALSELMIKKSEGPQILENVKGAITRNSFLQGEPMRRDKLIKGPNSGFLSAMLPSGMRAVAISIDDKGSASAGGFILPNDRVDVIRIYRDEEQTKMRGVSVEGAQTILTNVRVLAIAQNLDEKSGDKADKSTALGSTATLELSPEQAELIVLAERMGGGTGSLRLTLRSMLDASGKTNSVADLGTGKAGGLTIVRAGSPQQASR